MPNPNDIENNMKSMNEYVSRRHHSGTWITPIVRVLGLSKENNEYLLLCCIKYTAINLTLLSVLYTVKKLTLKIIVTSLTVIYNLNNKT